MNFCGVYEIVNLNNGNNYVGSAVNIHLRWLRHKNDLKAQFHHNSRLQRSWNKHGESSFEIKVLEVVEDPKLLADREQFWIDNLNPSYNILRYAKSALGYKHTEEAKKKNSELSKKWWNSLSLEQKSAKAAAHSEKLMGRITPQETRLKQSASHKAAKPHENSIKNLFEARNKDPEYYFKAADARAKTYYIATSPDGEEIEVRNMSQFCREKGLSQAHMVSVAKGKRKQHKEWKCRYKPTLDK